MLATPPRCAYGEAIPFTYVQNPPPFIIRLYHPADLNVVRATVAAAMAADEPPLRTTAADLVARLQQPSSDARLDPADDLWVAVVPGAGVVAFANGALAGDAGEAGAAEATYRTECFVHPKFRRRGIGRALLTRQWSRAKYIVRRFSRDGPPLSINLAARTWEQQTDALALFEASGLRRARVFLEMRRELAEPVPAVPAPAGVRLQPWLDRRTDEAVWAACNEAFADHWGHAAEPFDSFMRRVRTGRMQPENSVIARAGDAVVGASLNEMGPAGAERLGARRAWIHQLFVRPAWSRRGIGHALLAASLARARQLGETSASLSVDAENSTGAVALYEKLSFRQVSRRLLYLRPYANPAPEA